jgi:hypothetical protein
MSHEAAFGSDFGCDMRMLDDHHRPHRWHVGALKPAVPTDPFEILQIAHEAPWLC